MTDNFILTLKKESVLKGVEHFSLSFSISLVFSFLVCISMYLFSDFTINTILKYGIGFCTAVQAMNTNKNIFKLIGQQFSNDILFKNTPAMVVCVFLNVIVVAFGVFTLFGMMQDENPFLKSLIAYFILIALTLGSNQDMYELFTNKKEDIFWNLSVGFDAAVSVKSKPFLMSCICYIVLLFIVGLTLISQVF